MYYMPLIEIKDFKVLTDNKIFCAQPVTKEQEVYKKLVEMSRNNDYTTGNLLDHSRYQNCQRHIRKEICQDKRICILLNKLISNGN